jgi:hypothetical protein
MRVAEALAAELRLDPVVDAVLAQVSDQPREVVCTQTFAYNA